MSKRKYPRSLRDKQREEHEADVETKNDPYRQGSAELPMGRLIPDESRYGMFWVENMGWVSIKKGRWACGEMK